jgi:hypothetical protein
MPSGASNLRKEECGGNAQMVRSLYFIIMIATIGLGLQACGLRMPPPAPQEACNFVQNSEQQRVSWGARAPVVLFIDSSVPSAHFEAMRTAADEWNKVIGREVLKIGGWTNSGAGPKQDRVNGIYYIKDWENDRTNEQARTTVYWAGDQIFEADIRINGRDFQYFDGESPVVGRVDMVSLMIHEFGHVLGLSHAATSASVMAPSLPSASSQSVPNPALRRKISLDDEQSIRCEY